MNNEKNKVFGALLEMSMHLQELCKDPAMHGIPESSLSLAQVRALNIIGHFEPDGISVKQLSLILKLSSGATSKLVDRIVRAGMIERIPAVDDRRFVRLILTSEARRLAEYHSQKAEELLATLLKDVSEKERADYLELNQRFTQTLWASLKARARQD